MNTPLISVITAVYNGSAFIEETIQSILGQTITNFEYIIIDDASTDDSVARIHRFTDPRIRLIRNTTNLRIIQTRNLGLKEAKGRYIALIDHDDVALPYRFEEQIEVISHDPEVVMVASYAVNIDQFGKEGSIRGNIVDVNDELKIRLLFRNPFVNSTLMFKNFYEDDFRYNSDYPLSEDYDFIVRLAEKGKLYLIKQVLLKYRIHSNNYSQFMNNSMIERGSAIKRRLLVKLGASPSDNDLWIHTNFEHELAHYDLKLLNAISQWTSSLIKFNQYSKIYNNHSFKKISNNELSIVAEKSIEFIKNNVYIYFKKPLFLALLCNPSACFRIIIKYLFHKF